MIKVNCKSFYIQSNGKESFCSLNRQASESPKQVDSSEFGHLMEEAESEQFITNKDTYIIWLAKLMIAMGK